LKVKLTNFGVRTSETLFRNAIYSLNSCDFYYALLIILFICCYLSNVMLLYLHLFLKIIFQRTVISAYSFTVLSRPLWKILSSWTCCFDR